MNFVNGFTDFMGHCSAMLTFLSCVCVCTLAVVSAVCLKTMRAELLFVFVVKKQNNTLLFLLKYHSIGYGTIQLERSFKKRLCKETIYQQRHTLNRIVNPIKVFQFYRVVQMQPGERYKTDKTCEGRHTVQ